MERLFKEFGVDYLCITIGYWIINIINKVLSKYVQCNYIVLESIVHTGVALV